MDLNEQQAGRLDKANELRNQQIDPYPTRSSRTHTAQEALDRFSSIEEDLAGEPDSQEITVAGRIVAIRDMGRSVFAHVQDGTGAIQVYLRRNTIGQDQIDHFTRYIDRGDILEATGRMFRTRTGEVTLEISSFRLLSKALNPPPEKWHGLTDVESRYRQRYADLIANDEVRQIFVTRTKAISAMREYLDRHGFLEFETPILQPLYGGAAARPFTTHYHALDQTFYLRIADELYLKRLIAGGFERVYEISKDFRNEGIDARHSPEFTMLEFYVAYADYRYVMELCEQMIAHAAERALGSTEVTWGEHTVDLSPPWRRVSLREALIDGTGIDFLEVTDQQQLYEEARALGADVDAQMVWPRIVDELLTTFVRPRLIEPTFVTDYPVQLSPLAKRFPEDPRLVERFQAFIAGFEMGNAFTELNDPMDQLERFKEQARDRAAGDEEAMPIDEDYINALMYGMPPTGGFGLGIDRLTMLFTGQANIREVILFPQMRSLAPGDSQLALDELSTDGSEKSESGTQ